LKKGKNMKLVAEIGRATVTPAPGSKDQEGQKRRKGKGESS